MEFGRIWPDEHPQVLQLLAECGLPTADVDQAMVRNFIGARSHGTLAGVIGLEPLGPIGLLRSLAVAPAHRGGGIGSRLCDEAESLARAQGVAHLYLLTTTAADWFGARGYARLDRAALPDAIQQSEQFRSLCPATAVAMHKVLSGQPA
jgi:amino-acid N-acetyltransferase